MRTLDVIYAYGHKNVRCSHGTTIEITKDEYLTKRGNCILGIKATKACFDLNSNLKNAIWKGKQINVLIKVGNLNDSFSGFGNSDLRLLHKENIVFRKSHFICERTALINCTKSSNELSRDLINSLNNPQTKVELIFKSS